MSHSIHTYIHKYILYSSGIYLFKSFDSAHVPPQKSEVMRRDYIPILYSVHNVHWPNNIHFDEKLLRDKPVIIGELPEPG